MALDKTDIRDILVTEMARARDLLDSSVGIIGFGAAMVFGPDGAVKQVSPFHNILTTAGDEYYARKIIAAISPANAAAPNALTGMKLGTGSIAAAKSGTGASLVTYLTASNASFDATFPSVAAVGADGGWNINYKASWAAGVATSATINEVVLVNDSGTNATSSATNTYARAVLSTVNKAAGDSLAITWTHKILGA